jgi:hypothetical protein
VRERGYAATSPTKQKAKGGNNTAVLLYAGRAKATAFIQPRPRGS